MHIAASSASVRFGSLEIIARDSDGDGVGCDREERFVPAAGRNTSFYIVFTIAGKLCAEIRARRKQQCDCNNFLVIENHGIEAKKGKNAKTKGELDRGWLYASSTCK